MMQPEEQQAVERFVNRAAKAAELLQAFPGEIWVAAHYDCDGIAAASVLCRALHRAGKRFRARFLERVSAEHLAAIAAAGPRLVIFLDIGSGYLDSIQQALPDCKIVVCDHHQPVGEIRSTSLLHLNPLEDGITEHISGAGVAYVLARALGPENRDLAALAIVGAIGDAQVGSVGADWGLFGLNKEMVKDAERAGRLKAGRGLRLWGRSSRPLHKALEWSDELAVPGVTGSESQCVQFLQELGISLQREGQWRTLAELSLEEQQKLAAGIIRERVAAGLENPEWIFGDIYELAGMALPDAHEFSTALNACGKLGKPWLGVSAAWDSGSGIAETVEEYRKQIGTAFRWLLKEAAKPDGAIQRSERFHAVLAGDRISEHLLSNAVSMLHRSGALPDKPLIAFAHAADGVKVSARASDPLVAAGVDLSRVIGAAARHCGGQGGGHRAAAGATIPAGTEQEFLAVCSALLAPAKALKAGSPESGHGRESGRSSPGEAEAARGRVPGAGQEVERKGLVRYLGPQAVR